MYDYLVVGAGLFGATFAHLARRADKSVLVVESRKHVGGNCHTHAVEGILVHAYGPHAFHTSDLRIWNFVRSFAEFNGYEHRVVARSGGRTFSVPVNMRTLSELWGVSTPEEAKRRLEEARVPCARPRNLEEWALSRVGRELYELLFKGYTEKQWGRPASELPASIIRRLPVRLSWDSRYHDDPYQGVPVEGYTRMVERMLEGCDVELGRDFLQERGLADRAKKTVYTGPVDAYFDYSAGRLEYRTLEFHTEVVPAPDLQGIAQVNYADATVPWTRSVEHRHFQAGAPGDRTVVTWERPVPWVDGAVPFYPVADERNLGLYLRYAAMASTARHPVLFGGRLGSYRYYNMDQAIAAAMKLAEKEGLF